MLPEGTARVLDAVTCQNALMSFPARRGHSAKTARTRASYPSLDELRESRRRARERAAVAAAKAALQRLRDRGVRAAVFGSLATGRFRLHSDVDFLVLECPRALRYRIETDVEACMQGLPFDVAYADEMREPWRSRALRAFEAAVTSPTGRRKGRKRPR